MLSKIKIAHSKKVVTPRTTQKVVSALNHIKNNYQYRTISHVVLSNICKQYGVSINTVLSYLTYGSQVIYFTPNGLYRPYCVYYRFKKITF